MRILDVADIHTYCGDSHILQGLSLGVEEGSAVAVLGRNGVGKTVLMHSIMGFIPPREGKIFFKRTDITHQAPYRIARMAITLIPQGKRMFPSLTVRENLEIASRNIGAAGWTIDKVLSLFPGLEPRLDNLSSMLSGGEQQMLACARGLVSNPDFLIMDEAIEGLSPLLVNELTEVFQQLKRGGLPILLVDHNLPFVIKLADYAYVLSRGQVVYESTPQELWQNEDVKARYLGV